jgi:hypothetical protein
MHRAGTLKAIPRGVRSEPRIELRVCDVNVVSVWIQTSVSWPVQVSPSRTSAGGIDEAAALLAQRGAPAARYLIGQVGGHRDRDRERSGVRDASLDYGVDDRGYGSLETRGRR